MFLSKIQASDDRSPFGNFWFEPISMRTMSGLRVSAESSLQLSAVFRAVTLLSGHIAMLPLIIKKTGALSRVAAHPLYKLFKKPNRWQNGFEWRQMLMGHLLLRGNAYNEIVDNAKGEILELVPLHPDRVKIEQLTNGDYRYKLTANDGTERTLQRGQVWHLRGLSSNGITGVSVIECARESMGLGLSAQAYGARYFANDARPSGGWISTTAKFADNAARQKFRESVQANQSGANRGKMMILDNGMEYHELGINNRDSQFLESRKFQTSDVARWFGVPLHKLADLDRATFSNIEQQSLEYITDSLLIWTEIWEAAIEDGLLFDSENLEIEFDFNRLTRGDSGARSNFAQKAIMAGYLTRNEARAMEGLEPLDGLDAPLVPLNMVEESALEEEETDTETAETETEPTETETEPAKAPKSPDEESARRLQAILHSNAERLARRIMKSGQIEVSIVASGLAIPEADVYGWQPPPEMTVEALTTALIALGNQP